MRYYANNTQAHFFLSVAYISGLTAMEKKKRKKECEKEMEKDRQKVG